MALNESRSWNRIQSPPRNILAANLSEKAFVNVIANAGSDTDFFQFVDIDLQARCFLAPRGSTEDVSKSIDVALAQTIRHAVRSDRFG